MPGEVFSGLRPPAPSETGRPRRRPSHLRGKRHIGTPIANVILRRRPLFSPNLSPPTEAVVQGCHGRACPHSDLFRVCRPSIHPQVPAIADSWILGTSL